jgi:hypothetical protein
VYFYSAHVISRKPVLTSAAFQVHLPPIPGAELPISIVQWQWQQLKCWCRWRVGVWDLGRAIAHQIIQTNVIHPSFKPTFCSFYSSPPPSLSPCIFSGTVPQKIKVSVPILCANRAHLTHRSIRFAKMGSRPVTPSNEAHGANPPGGSRLRTTGSRPNSYLASSGPGGASGLEQGHGPHTDASPLSQSLNKHEDSYGFNNNEDGSFHDGHHNMTGGELRRSSSQISQSQPLVHSKGGTLKKKASLRKTGSIKRSSSRRSSRAGSVRSLALGEKEKYGEGEEFNSAFYTPVPTAGSPTDILANRFQGSSIVLQPVPCLEL